MVVEHGGGGEAFTPDVIFGFNPLVTAAVILVAAYAVIITERVNRAVVALLGAGLMVLTGVLNQSAAIRGVDFNTIALLVGMMTIVGVSKKSGIFQYVAILTAKFVRGDPRLLMVGLSIITAVFSALLDNVTTVMLIVPVTLLLVEQLKLPAFPFLFTQIFASNIGGTATLIGDPPNILIGSAVGLGFMDFVYNVGPPALMTMILMMLIFDFMWGRKLKTSDQDRAYIMAYNEKEALNDKVLLVKSGIAMGLALLGFTAGHDWGYQPGTVALFCAALLLLMDGWRKSPEKQSKKVHSALNTVEWETIFFFIGLFIIVYGVETTGLLSILAHKFLAFTEGNIALTGMLILWVSAIASAVVDNIPFVATMIPMIKAMGPDLGGDQALMPLWWCLSLGACFGGNGSLVGASANLIVAGFAERAGERISFMRFLKFGFPLMLVTMLVASVYAWFVYLH